MKYFIYIISLITISSCTHADKPSPFTILLKGTWTNQVDSPKVQFREIFSFRDSICSFNNHTFKYLKYEINDSLLTIHYHTEDSSLNRLVSYKILYLLKDSLLLQPIQLNGKPKSPIVLFRVKEKNTIIPSKIYFISSGCYGSCPAMYVEIDSNKNMRFNGRSFTDLKEGYRGKIDNILYQNLLQKIRYLPEDSLKQFYEADWTDDQTVALMLITGNKEVTSVVYGNDKEPFELRLLLDYIMELYHHVHLQKDSTFNEQYIFTNKAFNKINPIVSRPPPFIPRSKR